MSILSEIFSWWGGNTWGTRLTIARQGQLIGTDELGNSYYEQKEGVGPIGPLGRRRRWVTYKDLADPSKVSPDWHGWLHYTVDRPPTAEAYRPRPWEKPHRANMTGTRDAYRPQGSIVGQGRRPKATGDYKPWRPD
jgi:NADH:ubiquinone oxidoreductase subunit